VAPAHRIHEHIRWLEMRRRVGMTHAPPLEAGKRVLFALRTPDLDQRMLRDPPSRRLHARGFPRLIQIHTQLVGMVEIVRPDWMRVQLETCEVGHPGECGGVSRDNFFGAAT